MKWSFEIGAPFGIPIRIHWTFLLLVGYVLLSQGASGGKFDIMNLILLLSVFTCVILHELGHSLAARRYGIKVLDITLWPLGGMARMERFPSEPVRQVVIASAGPAVSFALAGIFGAAMFFLAPILNVPTREEMVRVVELEVEKLPFLFYGSKKQLTEERIKPVTI